MKIDYWVIGFQAFALSCGFIVLRAGDWFQALIWITYFLYLRKYPNV